MGDPAEATLHSIVDHSEYNIFPSVLRDTSHELYEKAIKGVVERGGFTDEEFTEFYHGMYNKVSGIVWKIANNIIDPADHSEIVNDILGLVHRKITYFRSDSAATTWVYSIATNHTLNYIKKRKRMTIGPERSIPIKSYLEEEERGRLPEYMLHSTDASPEDEIIDGEMNISLLCALCKGNVMNALELAEIMDSGRRDYSRIQTLLNDKDGRLTMLMMAAVYGERYDFIADYFRIPEGTVKSSIFRIKEVIKPDISNVIKMPTSLRQIEKEADRFEKIIEKTGFDPIHEWCSALCGRKIRKTRKLEGMLKEERLNYFELSSVLNDLDKMMLVLFYSYNLPVDKIARLHCITKDEVEKGMAKARKDLESVGFVIGD
ncbi:MAG: hypothetical protein KKE20_03275 [Nanoarchaeota archaeon]|nr:hypothetical protein [Nanoarchaeota archaeon]